MAGMPMTRIGDAGEDANVLSQGGQRSSAHPGQLEKSPSQEYASLRRMALTDVEPGQHSRHAVLQNKVRPCVHADLQEYASLRRMALTDVERGQHSRHAVLQNKVRPYTHVGPPRTVAVQSSADAEATATAAAAVARSCARGCGFDH